MARRSTSGRHADEASASGQAIAASDMDVASVASSAMLDAHQQFMQWLMQAQQMQMQMLQSWMEAVNAASTQQPLLSSWVDMQARFAQQMQDQTAQTVRLLWNQSDRASGSSVAAAGAAAFSPTKLYEQAQSTYEALMRQMDQRMQGMTLPRM